MTGMEAFFEVHRDLPREGPGDPADVNWALRLADLPPDAAVCDAGCGPGGDIAALLTHLPQGRVLAVDAHAPFARAAAEQFAADPRVTARAGDMAALADQPEAPFDLIWCAGALYFLGVETGLATFRKALKPGGFVAFSEPALFTDAPSEAVRAFWEGYPASTEAEVCAQVAAAGFEILGTRRLSDVAWENYYRPMEARVDTLRPAADADLTEALDASAAEAAAWRRVKDETGYLLVLARPA
ncbi:class I SAM-dependent methyltransferase [Actibacterium sp. D379-3]